MSDDQVNFFGGYMEPETARGAGREDAKRFIAGELIDYEPFVALSDMHLVRKTVPVSFDALHKTVAQLDGDLWQMIAGSVNELVKKHGDSFNSDNYTEGLVEGVAAVWEKIREEVLKQPSGDI